MVFRVLLFQGIKVFVFGDLWVLELGYFRVYIFVDLRAKGL